jgi:predicted ABC-type transport system involved in lysophospholipase L1 biosynthesis ATPase subunit
LNNIIIINKNNEGSAAVLVSNDEGVATRSKRSLGIERYAQLVLVSMAVIFK